jgi:hypothetical protein
MRQTREPASLFGAALAIALGATVTFGVWIYAGVGGETTVRYVTDVATIVAALLATASCARAAVRQTDVRLRRFWWLLAAGCGAWALGEGIWSAYDLLGGDVPVSSWADAAYLAAVPPVVAALLVHPAVRGRTLGRVRSVLDALVIATSLFLLGWIAVLGPLRQSIELSSLDGLVALAYPLTDVVIVVFVVLVIRGTTSTVRLDLWYLLAGLLLMTFSDGFYTYLVSIHDYSSGDFIDTGWFAGYLAIALGACCSRSRAPAPLPAGTPPSLTRTAMVTPFLAMLAALVLVAVMGELGRSLDRVGLAAAFTLVVLVLCRQALVLVDVLLPTGEAVGSVSRRLISALEGPAAPAPRTRVKGAG